jgi:hypothetical protein
MHKTETIDNVTSLNVNYLNLIATLKKEVELMKSLTTTNGFFKKYFDELPRSTTHEAAFKKVNEVYRQLFGCDRFFSFEEFKMKQNGRN